MPNTYITEQCGAQWIARREFGAPSKDRTYWVLLVGGRSEAKPGVVGFYAASINAACDALNN